LTHGGVLSSTIVLLISHQIETVFIDSTVLRGLDKFFQAVSDIRSGGGGGGGIFFY